MKRNQYINRRDFLKYSSLTALPIFLNTQQVFSIGDRFSINQNESNDRILVLVQLQGGNDGLGCLYDGNQYDNLQKVRTNIIVFQNKIVDIVDSYGFHPAMMSMKNVWEDGHLGVLQNVGYPNQNRSHFRSSDIWHSASKAEEYISSGWLGRMYDLEHSDFPSGYPNNDYPHPFALTIGNIISETCQGRSANYSMAVSDPFNPGTIPEGIIGDIPDNCYGDSLLFLNDTVNQTNAYATVIKEAAEKGNNLSQKYELYGNTNLGQKFKSVARLISGGLKTKVYVVQLGGFDTHDNQVTANAADTGRHSDLLKQLSDAIDAFQDDINKLGLSDRVIGVTYSEFGRRVRSNGGLGTDHGTAAPMFLFGSCIENRIQGDSYQIDTNIGIEEGVPMQFDFRDVYGTVLEKWLGIDLNTVKQLIYDGYSSLPILKQGCVEPNNVVNDIPEAVIEVYPIPANDVLNIRFSGLSQVSITIFDALGGTIRTLEKSNLNSGSNHITTIIADLTQGTYFIHFRSPNINQTKKIIKL